MPGANPLVDIVPYNTGLTDGMNAGTTQNRAGGLSSGAYSAAAAIPGGSANITVAGIVGFALLVLLGFHLLGFRFAFDAGVGRK